MQQIAMIFLTSKSASQKVQFILIPEAQRNFRNELFDLVEVNTIPQLQNGIFVPS